MDPYPPAAHYEDIVMSMLFRLGAYPLFGGDTMGVGPPGFCKATSDYDGDRIPRRRLAALAARPLTQRPSKR